MAVVERELVFHTDDVFKEFTRLATSRLAYLFPALTFSEAEGVSITVRGPIGDEVALRREIQFALYRERIYAQTLDMRAKMYGRLFG